MAEKKEYTPTLEEQETHFNITGNNRHVCHIGTDDMVWVERLLRYAKPTKINGRWHEFKIPTDLIIRTYAWKNGTNKLRQYRESREQESA